MTVASSSSSERLSARAFGGLRLLAALACAGAALSLQASPAHADLRLCNMTDSRVGVAIGYRDDSDWVTEGWWNFQPRECGAIFEGELSARFYYLYAIDYDRGGSWGGRSMMCTSDREFTIRGVDDCLARGFDRNGFKEVDTSTLPSWTIQLIDPERTGAALR